MARKHAFGFMRRLDRRGKPPGRRRPAGRAMFRSLRIEPIEARVLLSATGVDSDGLLDITFDEVGDGGFALVLNGDSVVLRDLGESFVDSVSRLRLSSVFSNDVSGIGAAGSTSIRMETPPLDHFLPKEARGPSFPEDPEELVDISEVMREISVVTKESRRPETLESPELRKNLRREVDHLFIRGTDQGDQRTLAVDSQYAMVQTFELSGGDFDSVEEAAAAADRQSPAPRSDDPPPRRAAGRGAGEATQAAPTVDRQEHAPRRAVLAAWPATTTTKADEVPRDDQRVAAVHRPIGGGSRAAVFEELGDNLSSDLSSLAVYLDLGRNSGIAPAMLTAAGGQLLFGASWRSRRRLSSEPAVERPLRR